jgi:hypothetical protein
MQGSYACHLTCMLVCRAPSDGCSRVLLISAGVLLAAAAATLWAAHGPWRGVAVVLVGWNAVAPVFRLGAAGQHTVRNKPTGEKGIPN